jgi:hypothetical protein
VPYGKGKEEGQEEDDQEEGHQEGLEKARKAPIRSQVDSDDVSQLRAPDRRNASYAAVN